MVLVGSTDTFSKGILNLLKVEAACRRF